MEYIFFMFGIIYFLYGLAKIILEPIVKFIIQMIVFIVMSIKEIKTR